MSKAIEKDKNLMVEWLDQYISDYISTKNEEVSKYIEEFRKKYPDASKVELAKKIKNSKSFRNGLVGAATGLGGLLALPVTIPTDLVISWRIQIPLIYTIAAIFEQTANLDELKTDIYIILAGRNAQEIFKNAGVDSLNNLTKTAVKKHIKREVMMRMWRIIPRKLITSAGEKTVSGFMKLIPLIGAPVGFTFDFVDAQITGNFAIKYFKGDEK